MEKGSFKPTFGNNRLILPNLKILPSSLAYPIPAAAAQNLTILSSGAKVPFQHLSLIEAVQHRSQGLYYHYDKKYSWDHKCKSKTQLLIFEDDCVTPSFVKP
ncbi:hypothetical protein PVK06_012325 [Gossypium arboreum]|uniref:Uncharacterized protein n=1 Tax=Gossypium arboreum TaxID=29729 RepID=A0ABR0QB91_GOSAR|nr:hypothetical protein PVK06_012325 [Gossypium arboreum]